MAEYPENAWIWDDPMNGGRGWDTEDRGCSKKYRRDDTCTPNEECVSKAELEKVIREMKAEVLKSYPNTRDSEDVYAMQNWVEYRLREVMDK